MIFPYKLSSIYIHFVSQIINANSPEQFGILNASDDIQALLSAAGFANKLIGPSTKMQCYQDVLLYEVILKRRQEFEEIRNGLNVIGFVKFLERHREFQHVVFPTTKDLKVSVEDLQNIIKPPENMKPCEIIVFDFFQQYLQEFGGKTLIFSKCY